MKNPKPTDRIEKYLKGLTKEELITLILKFSPPSFFEAIDAQLASLPEAKVIFTNIEQEIETIFADEELLYNPSEFEHQLLAQLEKLRGLWGKLPTEIGDLILSMMRDVDQAFEDGYLYIEKYTEEDDYFESEAINDYIVSFVSSLPDDKRVMYVDELKEVLENFGYSTFLSVDERLPGS